MKIVSLSEERWNIPRTMQNTDNLNAVRYQAVKNDIIPNGEAAQAGRKVEPFAPKFGHLGERLAFCVKSVQPAVGSRGVFFCNVESNLDEVEMRLAGTQNRWHQMPFGFNRRRTSFLMFCTFSGATSPRSACSMPMAISRRSSSKRNRCTSVDSPSQRYSSQRSCVESCSVAYLTSATVLAYFKEVKRRDGNSQISFKMPDNPQSQIWQPRHNPWLITITVMMAVFMEVLDTSIANIALPHIAGGLSATPEEATWVLTSYLVSNAIVLPMTGCLGNQFGRKRVLVSCIFMFTLASALCGFAWNLPTLVIARILQGFGGGAMVPIAQAIMLESFPPQKRGAAMAVFAQGVVVGADSRPNHWRLDYGQLFVALDFLHQSPGGNFRGLDGKMAGGRSALHQAHGRGDH